MMFNCDYYYDCVCRFPHSAVPAGAASSSSSSSRGGDELEAIARSVEALILKSEKEITQSWAKALYKKHKKCRDPRFDPNSDQFVKVRLPAGVRGPRKFLNVSFQLGHSLPS